MKNIRQQLNQSADNFANANVLHQRVAKHLLEHLEPINLVPKNILDLGCGTGELFIPLNKHFPQATIMGVDLAEQRLKLIETSQQSTSLVSANALQLPFAAEQFELIISNLMLHWLTDLPAWLAEMQRLLCTDGLLIFSYYGPDTLHEVGKTKHHFYDMHDVGDALVRAQFNDPILDVERFTLEYDNFADLQMDLHANGESELFSLDNNSQENIDVTYEIVYAHAWKGRLPMTSKIDQDGMVRVSLEQLLQKT